MTADLAIRGGTYVLGDGTMAPGLGLVIKGDRIVAVCLQDEVPEAKRVIDAAGKYVVPGFIDPHVHTRAPGFEYKEDFETSSAAAVAGGTTTFLAMFNVNPPAISADNARNLIEHGRAHSRVNFNVVCLVVENNLGEIPAMAALKVAGFKFLMGYKSEVSAWAADSRGWACPPDGIMLDAMGIIADTRVPLTAHAENDDIIGHQQDVLRRQGRKDPLVHLEARPNIAEEEAISRLILYTRARGNKLHILHLPGKEGVRLVREAQRAGLPVTAETCPQYLLMTHEEHVARYGTVAKINPPIRSKADQDALWEAVHVHGGGIDVIGTDHSPHTEEEKMFNNPHEDMWSGIAGFIGVETRIPLMLTEVNRGRVSLTRVVELCSTNPAKIFGLYPDRGILRTGGAADIAILNLQKPWVIDRRKLHSKTKVTPFDGWKVQGKPIYTIVNGKIAYEDDVVYSRPGDGRFIPAQFSDGEFSQSR